MLGGSGSGDSSSVVRGGGKDLTRETGQVKEGESAAKRASYTLRALKEEQRKAEKSRLEQLKAKVEDVLAQTPKLAALGGQIRLDMTKEGLRIQIIDEGNRPMFDSGSAVVKPYMRELLRELGSVLTEVPNRLTVEGHTDAQPFSAGDKGYSNWELSADRANASRRELVAGGLSEARMLRVQGLAASKLLDAKDPNGALNRRISIIVMNRDAEDAVLKNTPDEPEADAPADPAAAQAPGSGVTNVPGTGKMPQTQLPAPTR
jgi:chemotaxis protein MotB